MIKLNAQQEAAIPVFVDWFRRISAGDPTARPGFVVLGYAGTGKTTLALELIKAIGLEPGEYAGAALQASVAANLERMTRVRSKTLHRWNYTVEARVGMATAFRFNDASDIRQLKLLIVDEISQVSLQLWNDTLRHGVPILILGDPGQRQPVDGVSIARYLTPDVVLTEIHRQAAGNPIVSWSMAVREQGLEIPFGEFRDRETGEVLMRKVPAVDLTHDDYLGADAILVWKNDTRHALNWAQRRRLGIRSDLPVAGERIVCRRKNQEGYGIVNGFSGHVLEPGIAKGKHAYTMTFRLHETGMIVPTRACRRAELGVDTGKFPEALLRDMSDIGFDYTSTVDGYIGRQADQVLIIDEHPRRDGWREWMYTALTRASKRVVIAVP